MQRKTRVIGVVMWLISATFFLYEFFLRTFVGSIAHQLIHDLHLNIEQFTLIGSAYYIAYGVMQIPVGILVDTFGVKKVTVFATLSCALATYLFSHSNGFFDAAMARFCMGFGSSFAFICLLMIVADWFPRRYFSFFVGASQFIGTMGPFLAGGPLITWLTSSHIGWRSALVSISAVGILLSFLTLVFFKKRSFQDSRHIVFLSEQRSTFVKFKELMKTPQAWAVGAYSACIYVSIAVMAAVWGTDYMQTVGLSQSQSAYMISIAWIAYAIGCPVLGLVSDLTRRRKPALVACSLLGLVSLSAILYLHFHSVYVYGMFFFMLGIAASGQNVGFAAIAEHVSSDIKATALGMNNAFITLLVALSPFFVDVVIRLFDGTSNAENIPHQAFVMALSILVIAFIVASLISIFAIKETYCKPQKELFILRAERLDGSV